MNWCFASENVINTLTTNDYDLHGGNVRINQIKDKIKESNSSYHWRW